MKSKQLAQARAKTIPELETQINQMVAESAKMRVDLAGGRLKGSQLLNQKRHDLARLKTILQERRLNEKA